MMNQTEALTPLQNKALTHIQALGKIRFQGMFLSRDSQQWNQRLGEITRRNEAEVLRSNSPTQIAKIMTNLEKEYFKIINEALQSIPLDEPVKNKKNRLDTLSLLEEALIDMNFSFADNAQEIIQDGLQHHPENDLWVKLNKINDHISYWDQELELSEDSKLKVQAMIQTQKNIILLSMIKCIEHEKGRELINELSSHLDDQHKIHIAVAFSAITADSIEISPTNTSAFVSANLEEPPRSISEYDTQPLLLKPSSNTNVIGSGSIFQIPIETDEDYQLDETLKDENVVENILKKTMHGAIYFNE